MMTKFIDYIQLKILKIVPLNDNYLFKSISANDKIEKYNQTGMKYSFSFKWESITICINQLDIDQERKRTIEKFKYAIYEDLYKLLIELKDHIHNYDFTNSIRILNKIFEEIR